MFLPIHPGLSVREVRVQAATWSRNPGGMLFGSSLISLMVSLLSMQPRTSCLGMVLSTMGGPTTVNIKTNPHRFSHSQFDLDNPLPEIFYRSVHHIKLMVQANQDRQLFVISLNLLLECYIILRIWLINITKTYWCVNFNFSLKISGWIKGREANLLFLNATSEVSIFVASHLLIPCKIINKFRSRDYTHYSQDYKRLTIYVSL